MPCGGRPVAGIDRGRHPRQLGIIRTHALGNLRPLHPWAACTPHPAHSSLSRRTSQVVGSARQRERARSCATHGEHQHGVGHLAVHAGRRRARDDGQRPSRLRVDAEQQAAGKEARGAGRGGGRGGGARGGRGGRRGDQAQGREAAADRAQEGLQGEDPEEGVLLVQRDWQRRHSRSGPKHPLPGGGAVQQGELRRRVHQQLRLGRDPGGGVRTVRSRAPRSSCVIIGSCENEDVRLPCWPRKIFVCNSLISAIIM